MFLQEVFISRFLGPCTEPEGWKNHLLSQDFLLQILIPLDQSWNKYAPHSEPFHLFYLAKVLIYYSILLSSSFQWSAVPSATGTLTSCQFRYDRNYNKSSFASQLGSQWRADCFYFLRWTHWLQYKARMVEAMRTKQGLQIPRRVCKPLEVLGH